MTPGKLAFERWQRWLHGTPTRFHFLPSDTQKQWAQIEADIQTPLAKEVHSLKGSNESLRGWNSRLRKRVKDLEATIAEYEDNFAEEAEYRNNFAEDGE